MWVDRTVDGARRIRPRVVDDDSDAPALHVPLPIPHVTCAGVARVVYTGTRRTSDGSTTRGTRKTARSPRRRARPSPLPFSRCVRFRRLTRRALLRPTPDTLEHPRDATGIWYRIDLPAASKGQKMDGCNAATWPQVLRELYVAERDRRNILMILSENTRRTKMVALASGSHRCGEP
jgi:hypothetical protein